MIVLIHNKDINDDYIPSERRREEIDYAYAYRIHNGFLTLFGKAYEYKAAQRFLYSIYGMKRDPLGIAIRLPDTVISIEGTEY